MIEVMILYVFRIAIIIVGTSIKKYTFLFFL